MNVPWLKPGKRVKRQLSISGPVNFQHIEHIGADGETFRDFYAWILIFGEAFFSAFNGPIMADSGIFYLSQRHNSAKVKWICRRLMLISETFQMF